MKKGVERQTSLNIENSNFSIGCQVCIFLMKNLKKKFMWGNRNDILKNERKTKFVDFGKYCTA